VQAYRLLGEICRIAKLVDLLYAGNMETQRDLVYINLADKEIYEILVSNIRQFEQLVLG
jgi:hypothetical protein